LGAAHARPEATQSSHAVSDRGRTTFGASANTGDGGRPRLSENSGAFPALAMMGRRCASRCPPSRNRSGQRKSSHYARCSRRGWRNEDNRCLARQYRDRACVSNRPSGVRRSHNGGRKNSSSWMDFPRRAGGSPAPDSPPAFPASGEPGLRAGRRRPPTKSHASPPRRGGRRAYRRQRRSRQ